MKHTFKIFNRDYDAKLIDLFLDTTLRSILANAIAVTLMAGYLYQVLPFSFLIPWVLAQVFYLTLRFYLSTLLKKHLYHDDIKLLKYLKLSLLLVFSGGLLWGALIIYSVSSQISFEEQLVILITLSGIIAGSQATISAFFIAFQAFSFAIVSGVIIAFSLHFSHQSFFIILLTLIFVFIIHSAASTFFLNMKNSIDLASKLESSQKSLAKLNETLEQRIKKEVHRNQEHMNHMLHQSRLAQMGEMLSMIAHQWRQPLTAITTSVASLKFHTALSKTLDESLLNKHMNEIENYALHLSTTINDFRGFFKTTKERSSTSFLEIYQDTLKLMQSSLVIHNIHLEMNIKKNESFISFPNELKQVVLNILKNAEDVLIEKEVLDPTISITINADDKHVYLCIDDNAGGIPEKNIDNIFDPYFTTKTYSDGTGLGLYMSRTIVQEHCKGRLYVKNRDLGARFTIALEKKFIS